MNLPADVAEVLDGRRQWALVQGDNRDVLPLLPDKSVAHVITDPPYRPDVQGLATSFNGFHGKRQFIKNERSFGYDSLSDELRAHCGEQFARLVSRWALVFCDVESVGRWIDALAALRYVRTGAWVKPNAAPQFTGDRPAAGFEACVISHAKGRLRWNGGGLPAVWHELVPINGPKGSERHHPTPKPISLMLRLVELFTDPADVVLDPFAGSATTGVACLRLGRRFIGVEKDAGFYATALERLQAEQQGLTLKAARAGQLALFAGGT